jgi:predicted nucleic acid-binding protein
VRDAFDADALIYAAVRGHPLGRRVLALFRSAAPGTAAGAGSVLLLPEVLGRPLRAGSTAEIQALAGLLARLDLRPVDRATAVAWGAERFITNNRRDFGPEIKEVDVTYPDALPDRAP